MNLFRFASPYWLFALAPLFALGIFDVLTRRQRRSATIFSTVSDLQGIPLSFAARVKKFMPTLFYLSVASMIVALARPQMGARETRIIGNGVSIVMCVDKSGSMEARDFEINGKPVSRLKAVKKVFKDFVVGSDEFKGRQNDLVGLIAFGGFVDSICPLTLDHESLVALLDDVKTPTPIYDSRGAVIRTRVIDEESGTAIGDALAAAVERLKESKNKTKIVVLLSDGMQTTGALSPEDGVKIAQAYGVKVYTIGVGSSEPVPFPSYLPNGDVIMSMQQMDFNPETLQTIAQATNGRYFFAGDSDSLKHVCEEIDRLEKTRFDAGTYAEYRDIYLPFALLGILGAVLLALLRATRMREFP